MIEFRTDLENKLTDLISGWVGPSSTLTEKVKTFSDHIDDVSYENFPYVVINVRTMENSDSEIGNQYDLTVWEVHIYYMDISTTYTPGKERRNLITGVIAKNLQKDRFLGQLEATDGAGTTMYVYDSKITSAIFDSSGQEEDYSFVTELYLQVYTATR